MIHSPRELRQMNYGQLVQLAEDVRQRIIETCLKNGGHLGASLGTVELAIALHRVFESPREPIVWDVGHQAYAHKLLTGRWDRFSTLRQYRGVSGFLAREESAHDVFGAGHSSTSLSAALAFAWSAAQAHEPEQCPWTVAVIGDGGLTAGLALEALNNIKSRALGPMLVVLNDNQMSIAENIGAIPAILSGGGAAEFFGSFGLDYVGPIDGHRLDYLIGTIEQIRQSRPLMPVLLHVHTHKGKGYTPAEERPAFYHGISPLSKEPAKDAPKERSFSEVFGQALCRLAQQDPRVVAITAAMPEGTGLQQFSREFPDRFFDVGIAEAHAVTFAAGLAAAGYRPIVAIYSTFLQRAVDSIIHDVCLQQLPVIFALDRAGLVGADGPTHHGAFDLAYLGPIPHLTVVSPNVLDDMDGLLSRALASNAPFALRYPRGGTKAKIEQPLAPVRLLSRVESPEWAIVALGTSVARAQAALSELNSRDRWRGKVEMIAVTDAKPVPTELVSWLDARPELNVLVIEDGVERGGFAQALAATLHPRKNQVHALAYPDRFIGQGSMPELEEEIGFSPQQIVRKILTFATEDDG